MFTGNIKFILSTYQKHFKDVFPLERYKWQLIKIFQENWDIEDADFAGMMGRALPAGKIHNLLDNGAFYAPLANIRKMAQQDPRRVQALFSSLLTEDYDFDQDRSRFRAKLNDFKTGMNDLFRDLHLPGSGSHVDDQATLFFLTCKFPDRFCFYKPADFEKAYALAGLDFLVANSSKFDKLCMYLILWHCMRYEIDRNPELEAMAQSKVNDEEYPDPCFTMLAQEILHALNYPAVAEDIQEQLRLQPRQIALPNHLRQATNGLPVLSLLPSGHMSRYEPSHNVPVKLVCKIEQDAIDRLGLGKVATPYSIFHGPEHGFDVLSYDSDGQEKYVLVKVTKADFPQTIELSQNETERLSKSPNRCSLYLIYQYDENLASGLYLVKQL